MSPLKSAQLLEIVFVTVPMMGHMIPLLPFAEQLQNRGHTIKFVHPSEPKFRRKIEEVGLGQVESVLYEASGHLPDMHEIVKSHYDTRQSATKPSVVVYDFFAADAADFADSLGIPAVGVFPNPRSINPWAASSLEQDTLKWKLWSAFCGSVLEGILARILWMKRNWSRRSRNLSYMREQDIYPTPYMPRNFLGVAAAELEPNPSCSPLFHRVGPSLTTQNPPLGDELQQWLQSQEKPIVYVASGTMSHQSEEKVRSLQDQLLQQDVSVIWSLPVDAQKYLRQTSIPSHWRIERFVPQVSLLQSNHVAAFVTHCGSNSVSEALLSGVPMVCCPGFADQPANAARISKAGVGVIAPKTENVGTALRELLNELDRYTLTSQKLADTLMKNRAAERGADIIETIALEGVPENGAKGKLGRLPLMALTVAFPAVVSLL